MSNNSQHSQTQLNLPLNLDRFKGYSEGDQRLLTWFHQHVIERKLTQDQIADAVGYDFRTIWNVLNHSYKGDYAPVLQTLKEYKTQALELIIAANSEFVETSTTKLICSGLTYCLNQQDDQRLTVITGESRMGKTAAASWWQAKHNHGRTILVRVPATGGEKGLMCAIAEKCGVSVNHSAWRMQQAITRAFNRDRMIILDEAHRLLPGKRSTTAGRLEFVRDLLDDTGVGIALMATDRFDRELRQSEYMFEQVLGRIGMPVRLPGKLDVSSVMPIIAQFLPGDTGIALDIQRNSQGGEVYRSGPWSRKLVEACVDIANKMGRLGVLMSTIKFAARLAGKQETHLTEEHFFQALKVRKQMSGEYQS